jgi:hypothetical protein
VLRRQVTRPELSDGEAAFALALYAVVLAVVASAATVRRDVG